MSDKRMNPTRAVMLGICGLAAIGVLAVGVGHGSSDAENAPQSVQLMDQPAVSAPSMAPGADAAATFDEIEGESNVDGFDPAGQDPQADAMAAEPGDAASTDDGSVDVTSADPSAAQPDESVTE